MAETGILARNEKVELINGEIFKNPKSNSRHSGAIIRMSTYFQRLFLDGVIISVKNPITIDEYSEPEPDIALLKYREDSYTDSHPTSSDVYLIIEVSDTLACDKGTKKRLYAMAEVPEYWIVNLPAKCIEMYKKPDGEDYLVKESFGKGEEIVIDVFDIEIKTVDLLG